MSKETNAIDRLDGCSIDQRIEAMHVSDKSGLTARYIAAPKKGMTDLYKACDQFRCQVGRVFTNTGVVVQSIPKDGRIVNSRFPWIDHNNFELLGFGSTFGEALDKVKSKHKSKSIL